MIPDAASTTTDLSASLSETELNTLRALHARYAVGWEDRIRGLFAQAEVSPAEIDEALRAPHVRGTRTSEHVGVESLYQGRASDLRIRLFDTLVAEDQGLSATQLARALMDPHAADVDGLVLGNAAAVKATLEALDSSPLRAIRRLKLFVALKPEELGRLLAHPKCAGLEVLELNPSTALGDARVRHLVDAPVTASLRRLVLWHCEKLTAKAFVALGSASFDALVSFKLSSSEWLPRKSAREALFAASWLANLRVVDLDCLSTEEVQALTRRLDAPRIAALGLRMRGGNEPASSRVTKPLLARLRSCQALWVSTHVPGAHGIVDAVAHLARELEEVRVGSLGPVQEDYTRFNDLAGGTAEFQGRAAARMNAAGFGWRWF